MGQSDTTSTMQLTAVSRNTINTAAVMEIEAPAKVASVRSLQFIVSARKGDQIRGRQVLQEILVVKYTLPPLERDVGSLEPYLGIFL